MRRRTGKGMGEDPIAGTIRYQEQKIVDGERVFEVKTEVLCKFHLESARRRPEIFNAVVLDASEGETCAWCGITRLNR